MHVWPNFISATERNIICVWVCRESQPLLGLLADEGLPQLGLFAKGRCHKKECITANKSKFPPKASESSRLGENPSDRQVYHGNSCMVEGHKKLTPSSQDELQFARVRYGVWNASLYLSQLYIRGQLQVVLIYSNNTLISLYIKRQGGMRCFEFTWPHHI